MFVSDQAHPSFRRIFNSQRRKGTLLLLFMNGKIYFPSVSGTLRHSPGFLAEQYLYIFEPMLKKS